jgi:hypothetical protein
MLAKGRKITGTMNGRWGRFWVCGAALVAGCGSRSLGGVTGGSCTDDGGLPVDSGLSAFGITGGTFISPDIDAIICKNGAFAYLEPTAGYGSSSGQFVLIIDSTFYGAQTDGVQFQKPVDAVSGELTAFVEIAGANPGRYTNGVTCGDLAISALLPIPPSVNCEADAGTGSACPPGCALEGPILGLSCMPFTPEIDYQANTASDCLGDTATPQGSWTLTLTSVVPGDNDRSVVHGTLSAQLLGGRGDAGVVAGSLSIEF